MDVSFLWRNTLEGSSRMSTVSVVWTISIHGGWYHGLIPQGPENGLRVAGEQHLHAPVLHAQQGALYDFQQGVVAAHGDQ